MSDVWSLIKAQKFTEACEEADAEFARSGDLFPLRNKVFALLQLNKFKETTSLVQRIIDENQGSTDSDFIFLGVARWLDLDHNGAIQAWHSGKHSKYTDAAGGLEIPMLLLFAATKLGDEALRKQALKSIEKLARAKSAVNWPGPLARYLMELGSEQELIASINPKPILHEKQKCQVDFYLGVKSLQIGDQAGFRKSMIACAGSDIVSATKPEFHLAKGECKNF